MINKKNVCILFIAIFMLSQVQSAVLHEVDTQNQAFNFTEFNQLISDLREFSSQNQSSESEARFDARIKSVVNDLWNNIFLELRKKNDTYLPDADYAKELISQLDNFYLNRFYRYVRQERSGMKNSIEHLNQIIAWCILLDKSPEAISELDGFNIKNIYVALLKDAFYGLESLNPHKIQHQKDKHIKLLLQIKRQEEEKQRLEEQRQEEERQRIEEQHKENERLTTLTVNERTRELRQREAEKYEKEQRHKEAQASIDRLLDEEKLRLIDERNPEYKSRLEELSLTKQHLTKKKSLLESVITFYQLIDDFQSFSTKEEFKVFFINAINAFWENIFLKIYKGDWPYNGDIAKDCILGYSDIGCREVNRAWYDSMIDNDPDMIDSFSKLNHIIAWCLHKGGIKKENLFDRITKEGKHISIYEKLFLNALNGLKEMINREINAEEQRLMEQREQERKFLLKSLEEWQRLVTY